MKLTVDPSLRERLGIPEGARSIETDDLPRISEIVRQDKTVQMEVDLLTEQDVGGSVIIRSLITG
jgi:hypothetical protein